MNSLPLPWNVRHPDYAALLNPFFFGVIIRASVTAYQAHRGLGLPFPLVFIVPPICLHPAIASALPKKTTKGFRRWLRENSVARAELADTASKLSPHTREALAVALAGRLLRLVNGTLMPGQRDPVSTAATQDDLDQLQSYLQSADFIGRWLSAAGPADSIYEAIGIRP